MAAAVGNQYAKRAAKWRDALERAMAAQDEGKAEGSTLFKIATQVINRALDGDQKAIEELANRLDGKPAQSLAVSGPDGGPVQIEEIVIRGIDPAS